MTRAQSGNGRMAMVPAPVSSKYCLQAHVAELIIDQKVLTLSGGKFAIHDSRGSLLFSVRSKNPFGLHTKRVLRDASGNDLVLLQKKILTMHDRWAAYRGNQDIEINLLFTMGKSSLIQFKPSFNVFLPENKSSKPDFTVRGDFLEHNYTILYKGTTIAEAKKKWKNVSSIVAGKDRYGVTVYPGVDQAFIASLIVIVDQVKQEHSED